MQPPPARFTVKAVGVSFVPGYPANVYRLTESQPLELRRNPANEHDGNAIEVHATSGMVGHLPAYLAARIAPWLDAGNHMRAEVESVLVNPDAPELPGVSVLVNLD